MRSAMEHVGGERISTKCTGVNINALYTSFVGELHFLCGITLSFNPAQFSWTINHKKIPSGLDNEIQSSQGLKLTLRCAIVEVPANMPLHMVNSIVQCCQECTFDPIFECCGQINTKLVEMVNVFLFIATVRRS
jgi:hypothetical protein